MIQKALCAAVLLLAVKLDILALDLWRHPEAAEKNSLFLDTSFAALSFADDVSFTIGLPVEIRLDYLPPVFLPFSIGTYFKTPNPNLTSFGARLGYHIDIRDPKTDLYAVYIFDCGFIRNELLEAYGDEPQPVNYYDFRAGVRRLFGSFLCLTIETDFKLRGLCFALSIKIL